VYGVMDIVGIWKVGDKYYVYGEVKLVFNWLKVKAKDCRVTNIVPFPAYSEEADDFILIELSDCELEE